MAAFKELVIFLICYQLATTEDELSLMALDEILEYKYEIGHDLMRNETILRQYILMETTPTTSFLCPKNYYINDITQQLLTRQNSSVARDEQKSKKHHAMYRQTNGDFKLAPCPTIFRCLGYQACLFKFGNEFCMKDPSPNLRKILHVSIACLKDSIKKATNTTFDMTRTDKVLHLSYRSRLDDAKSDSIRNYTSTELVEFEIDEDLVFGPRCNPVSTAVQKDGFQGKCTETGVARTATTEQIWSFLGRTKSQKCRDELVHVFCANQYNANGLCMPPMLLNKNDNSRRFNFNSLPFIGERLTSERRGADYRLEADNLIPARLGFLLLLHKDVNTAIQLLLSIWKPYNEYVIHVDKRSQSFLQELVHFLADMDPPLKNVVVLPETRSFSTSWGSYEIVRAQLEGMEELLRRGQLDFIVNLSGADLPIRDVDDLSASLAPHRGLNFLIFAHWINNPAENNSDTSSLNNAAFYSCDYYVYNVSLTSGMPDSNDLRMYNAPQWGVFSRDFVEYLVDEKKRSPQLNKFQFYLQTHVIPDESYIVTILMNSPFNQTLRKYHVHAIKEFAPENLDHLCRHSTDADFCGQFFVRDQACMVKTTNGN